MDEKLTADASHTPMTGTSNSVEGTLCSECQEVVGLIRKIRKYFCTPCWIHHCNFRFRKRLFELGRPTKGTSTGYREADGTLVLNPRENVLIVCDGSESARALLTLIREAVAFHLNGGESHYFQCLGKLPFPFSFTILHIVNSVSDDGKEGSLNGNNEIIAYLQRWLKDSTEKLPLHFPYPLVVTSLEKSLVLSQQQLASSENETPKNYFFWNEIKDQGESEQIHGINSILDIHRKLRLCLILQNIKSKTSRIDLLQCLRQKLVASVAKELRVEKVFLPENQTSMAVNMFSIMSTGRGSQLAEQMNLVTRWEGVDLTRPLMDLSTDDLRDYLNALETPAAVHGIVDKNKKRIDNIRSQCEQFIVTLQRDYPGTVPTLTRIGTKLEPNTGDSSTSQATHTKKCKLCQYYLNELDSHDLCYGCQSILKDMKTPSLFQELLS